MSYTQLLKRLGVSLSTETLRLALTHRSYSFENGGIPHNERLEFLGDSVLGMTITDRIYHEFPEYTEGQLAKLRSAVVSSKALARVARGIGLGEHILLGEGERKTNGAQKTSILADTMEAVFGAVFIDCGAEQAQTLVLRLVAPLIHDEEAIGAGMDWKTVIQEYTGTHQMGPVVYEVTGVGPDHSRTFTAVVTIAGDPFGTGTGSSKKEAERSAAHQAWKKLQEQNPQHPAPSSAR